MSNAERNRCFRELAKVPENKYCADCGDTAPQWASATLGTLICLTCSGVHRSLGVHLSFVRSLTMDAWKPEELLRIRNGGNERAKRYFAAQGLGSAEIASRYGAACAVQWREAVAAGTVDKLLKGSGGAAKGGKKSAGDGWDDDWSSPAGTKSAPARQQAVAAGGGAEAKGDDDWGDW